MQYNVLEGALWVVNTTDGNKDVDFVSRYNLADYDRGPLTVLSGSDVLVVDFDLGYRLNLDRFEYKYTTSYADDASVASGIKFEYKDDSYDEYQRITTYFSDDSIFYTTTSSGIFAPRYLRLTHTVSDTVNTTTFSGVSYGFKAFNDDTTVDFGTDGLGVSQTMEAVRNGVPFVREVPIFNSGVALADAYVNLEPSGSDVDYTISVSNSSNGPWVFAFDPDDLVADSSNFYSGQLSDLDVSLDSIRLNGVDLPDGSFVSNKTQGIYTSKIISKSGADYCRFNIQKYDNHFGGLTVDKGDPADTMEIRSSNTPPKPYVIIREIVSVVDNTFAYPRYRDRWAETDVIKYTDTTNLGPGYRYSLWPEYSLVFDQATERYAGCILNHMVESRSTSGLYLINNTASDTQYIQLSLQSTTSESVSYSWFETKLDYTGGVWVYFYCQAYHVADFVNTKGYFLAYFDVNGVNQFKWSSSTKTIENIDNNYDTREVWYTRPESYAIYKVGYDGDVLINYANEITTNDLGGLAVLPDGNLIYGNEQDVRRLSSTGQHMDEYHIEDVAGDKLKYIVLDGDGSEAIWAIDGQSTGRLFISGPRQGTWDFKADTPLALSMTAVEGGVWVKCVGESGEEGIKMRFLSKVDKKVVFEWIAPDRCQPGLLYQTYDSHNYVAKTPIATDNVWSVLPWQKVNTEGYLASEDRFYQTRFTFRRQEPVERYPEFITDLGQDFFKKDEFTQDSSTPAQLLWGNWLNYPDLDRVYVDPVENQMILVSDPGGTQDSFVSTKDRVVVTKANDGFDIRIGFKVGSGVATGLSEYIYMGLYSLDEGFEGNNVVVRFYIPPNPGTNQCTIAVSINGESWIETGSVNGLDAYDAEMRIYWSSIDRVYCQVRTDPASSFYGLTYRTATDASMGKNFYVKVFGHLEGSPIRLTYFDIVGGEAFYHTDTQRVSSINRQRLVKIEDIYPNNHKNAYLNVYVPPQLNLEPFNNVDLKVRWKVSIQ